MILRNNQYYKFAILLILLHVTRKSAWVLLTPPRLLKKEISFRSSISFLAKYKNSRSQCKRTRISYLSSQEESQQQDENVNCDEEGECEIDWDSMPGFDETDEVAAGEVDDSGTSTTSDESDKYTEGVVEKTKQITHAMQMTSASSSNDYNIQYDDFADWKVNNYEIGTHSKHKNKNNVLDVVQSNKQTGTYQQLRTRLEMQWQMTEQTEECDVYKPITCGGKTCMSCNGKGTCSCRFCRGTGFIYMKLPGSSSIACTIPLSEEQITTKREELMFGGNLQSLLHAEPSSAFTACVVCQQKGIEICKQCRGSGWIADWTTTDITSP